MNFAETPNSQENPSKQTAPEEIEAIKKDLHMTGRALRIDESLSDYKTEREESWQKLQAEQKNKDQLDIANIRNQLSGADEAQNNSDNNQESYENLANVKLGQQKLQALLDNHQENGDLATRAEIIIYEMLTRRSSFVQNTEIINQDAADLMQNFTSETKWYRQTRDQLEQEITGSNELKWDSNPGWFGINTRPEEAKRDAINIKSYTTIPVDSYTVIQHLPELATQLRQLAISSDDIIQVKIPESFSGFMSHNDSIVIHFKKSTNADNITKLVNSWLQSHNIQEAPREMGRTKIAADSKTASFSNLVAQNIATWLEQNAGKYPSDLLSKQAVGYAISQSQKSPI